MGKAAWEDAKSKGELIQQRLNAMGNEMEGDEQSVLYEAAETIEWYEKRCDSLIDEIAELQAENHKLRKIAAHVPGKVYIAAKEQAGFAVAVRTAQRGSDDG